MLLIKCQVSLGIVNDVMYLHNIYFVHACKYDIAIY